MASTPIGACLHLPMPKELLDIKQAAEFLQVSETSLRRWTNSGRLACLRVGLKRERRFRRADLVAFMENQPVELAAGAERSSGAQDGRGTVIAGIPVAYGTHLCALYGNDAGRVRLAVAFLADGFGANSVCYLAGSPESRDQILDQLEHARPSLKNDVAEGRVVLSESHSTPHAQYEDWETKFVSALSAGGKSLRVVGDLSSSLEAGMSLDQVAEYERGYDRMIARRFPVVTLCMYDVRRFASLEVVQALKGHSDTFRYPAERLLA
jgi:excisionase family DNA binding protein